MNQEETFIQKQLMSLRSENLNLRLEVANLAGLIRAFEKRLNLIDRPNKSYNCPVCKGLGKKIAGYTDSFAIICDEPCVTCRGTGTI